MSSWYAYDVIFRQKMNRESWVCKKAFWVASCRITQINITMQHIATHPRVGVIGDWITGMAKVVCIFLISGDALGSVASKVINPFSDLFAEEVDKCDYKLNKKEYGCIYFEKQSLDEYYACNVQNVDRRVIWKVFLIQVAKTNFILDGWKNIIIEIPLSSKNELFYSYLDNVIFNHLNWNSPKLLNLNFHNMTLNNALKWIDLL